MHHRSQNCGLNKDGSHIFDFGSRQFELVLTTEKPMVRDISTGKLKSNLPKPAVKDRADLAHQVLLGANRSDTKI